MHKLVEHRPAADEHAGSDVDVPAKQHVVGDHHAVGNDGVVPHVNAGHQKAVVAHARLGAVAGAPVEGGILANAVVFTQDHPAFRGRVERVILGVGSDDGSVADGVVGPHANPSRNHRVRLDLAPVADLRRAFNDRIRADANAHSEFGFGVNDGGGVNQ